MADRQNERTSRKQLAHRTRLAVAGVLALLLIVFAFQNRTE